MTPDHAYRNLNEEELENLLSSYLIDNWSYSGVSTFARNEKAFEMSYVYRTPFKNSSASVAGSAYHKALQFYFEQKQEGKTEDLARLQMEAFEYIDGVSANEWKLQKTTPSIEECKIKTTKLVTSLIENFFTDISVYEDDIKEILFVELYCKQFLTINGVDIPLPCKAKIDLGFVSKDGKHIIVDHKSKTKYTDEKEIKLSIGKQAITYIKCYETLSGEKVDEVWFVENKVSKNKDGSPQLVCHKIVLDDDVRRLYEAMLYENLKRMLDAVSDPNYVYLMNEFDNFVDTVEMHDFWALTMIAEVDDFNIPESKKEMIARRLKKTRDVTLATVDPKSIKTFRKNASEFIQFNLTNKDMTKEEKIVHVLRTLGAIVEVAHKFDGYSSDTFLLSVSAGAKMSSIHKYKLDIASALNVPSVRMMKDLYIHKGESFLAVEASKKREKDLLFHKKYLVGMKIPIGVNNFGETIVWDLMNQSTPHMLVCGSTGSGKSVLIISTVAYAKLAGMEEIIILDPKYEFADFSDNSTQVISDIDEIVISIALLVDEMDELIRNGQKKMKLIVFDEYADAVAASKDGFLEDNLKRILQKGRSVGFRVIAATQRASAKVITGDAKVNFPVQVCFRVPKEADSRVVIDENGAETLGGAGDGLMRSPQYPGVERFQGFYKKQ